MLWLYRFANGILNIVISGEFPERMINKCAKSGINLWNIKYRDNGIYFCISLKDFYKLFSVRKGLKIKVHIKAKKGLPFLMNTYKYRYGLILGAILFFIVLYSLSSFVWQINVSGNSRVKSSQIVADCKEIGIDIGTKKSKINAKICAEKLLIDNEKLAWAAINIEGCVLSVDVTEIKNEQDKNHKIPTNIRAAKDGVITKISVTAGNSVVKVGENITKGQLLVSGIKETGDSTQFVHSIGEIYALVEEKFTYSLKFKNEVSAYAQNPKKRRVLSAFGVNIPLYLGGAGKDYARGEVKEKHIFSKKIPISLHTRNFLKKEKTIKIYDKDFLVKTAHSRLENKLKNQNIKDYEIVNKEFKENKEGITASFTVKFEENIAYQDILLYNNKNS